MLHGRTLLISAGLVVFAYAAANIFITSGSTFWHDEWWYICGRSLSDIDSLLRPHNEHFVLLHAVVYRLLVDIFGLGSYLPFQLALIGVHVGAVAAVFTLVDRHAGRRAAAAGAVVLLFFGWGSLNAFWAFQIGFVGATALGLWSLVLLPRRPALAALVLVAAVATSGNGLIYPVVGAAYLLASDRIRSIWWMAVPVVAYGAWALTIGRAPLDGSAEVDIAGSLEWMMTGIVWAIAGVMGLGVISAVIGVIGLLVSQPTAWRSPLVIAAACGLLAEYAIIGLARQDQIAPWAGHYMYVGAAFVILIGATLLASAKRPRIGAVLVAIALTANIIAFWHFGSTWTGLREVSRLEGSDDVPSQYCYDSPTLEELKWQAGHSDRPPDS